MARGYMPAGGSGSAGSDECTALLSDVIQGKKAVTADSGDEAGTGTMTNKGGTTTAAVSSVDASNKRVVLAVPTNGYYNTSSKLYDTYTNVASRIGLTAAKLLQGQTVLGIAGTATGDGTAAASDIRTGKTAYVDGKKITGSLATQGGSTTTPGTANKTIVAATKIVTGNIIVAGDADLVAANIKKGVTIFGVTGTHSGYVPTATDLYLRGTNNAGFTNNNNSNVTFESGAIYIKGTNAYLKGSKAYDLSPYSKLNIEYMAESGTKTYDRFFLRDSSSNFIGKAVVSRNANVTRTVQIDISNENYTAVLYVEVASISGSDGTGTVGNITAQIYRIWLS